MRFWHVEMPLVRKLTYQVTHMLWQHSSEPCFIYVICCGIRTLLNMLWLQKAVKCTSDHGRWKQKIEWFVNVISQIKATLLTAVEVRKLGPWKYSQSTWKIFSPIMEAALDITPDNIDFEPVTLVLSRYPIKLTSPGACFTKNISHRIQIGWKFNFALT